MTFFSSPVIGRAAVLVGLPAALLIAMGCLQLSMAATVLDRRCLLRIVGLPSD